MQTIINNEVLLYSTGDFIQYPGINYSGKEYKKGYIYICVCVCVYIYIYIYIYMQLEHFAVQQKLTEPCKSIILQLKNKESRFEEVSGKWVLE